MNGLGAMPMNIVEVFVFIRLNQCKIETCILSNNTEDFNESWKQLTSNGWVLSSCKSLKINND